MIVHALFLLILYNSKEISSLNCNLTHGPSGDIDCLREKGSNYQFVRCVSREEAALIFKNNDNLYRNYCPENSNNNEDQLKHRFCKISCMTEYYNDDSLDVKNDCLCNPNNFDKLNLKTKSKPTIPNSCYNPQGNCMWYHECLEKRFSCLESSNDYAISYGEKYCKLFEENSHKFSLNAQSWIKNVKLCLQIQLVSEIKQYSDSNCSEIQRIAFISHTSCYLRPNGKSGICYLSFKDWWNIFFTMKNALIPFSGSALSTFKGVFEVGITCAWDLILNFY